MRKLRYRLRFERRFGRTTLTFCPLDLPVPRLLIHGEGDDYAYIGLSFSTSGSDPIAHIGVDLEGTKLGRVIAWCGWKWRSLVWWYHPGRHRRGW